MIAIKPFNILLQSGTDIGAFFIKLFTNSKYSHAAMALTDGLMIHSTFRTGVAIVSFETWRQFYGGEWNIYEYINPIDARAARIMNNFVYKIAGSPYDWRGVLSFVFPWIKQNSERYFCSELIAAAFKKAKLPLIDKPNWRISPADLSRCKYLRMVNKSVKPLVDQFTIYTSIESNDFTII